jgi:succinyl-CoA synthetase beta subunit
MMLLEHDAKELLAKSGIPVPSGFLATDANTDQALSLAPPWIVKAQVPVGGRGKAGGIRRVENPDELRRALILLQGMSIRGQQVRSCRVEEAIRGTECYLSFSLDAARGRLHVLASAQGGVDVEANAESGALLSTDCEFAQSNAIEATIRLTQGLSAPLRDAVVDAAKQLIAKFFELEATLLEINPLFVRADGSWVAGDVKLVADDNALGRQQELLALIRRRKQEYPEIVLKLDNGFDFIELDAAGEIGLVTTGAGLSMQLVDELALRGHRAFNFCDIRTGQLRGDPTRLIQVFRWIAAGRSVRSVLVNFFAGITDLGEIAHLLVAALKAVPELRVPVTARLIGNGFDDAMKVFQAAGSPLRVEPDLDKAIQLALAPLTESRS